MNQLFYNLMSNALKFTTENVPPVIEIIGRTIEPGQITKPLTLMPIRLISSWSLLTTELALQKNIPIKYLKSFNG